MAADKYQKDRDEITAVGPGVESEEPGTVAIAEEGEGYQYPEGDDEDSPGRHEDDAGEERVGHGEESDDDSGSAGLSKEQKRRRRKREKYERERRELAFLRTRNEQLEREHSRRLAVVESRQTQSDVLAIDGRIAQMENDVREAESLYAQARRSNDPDAEIEALRVRDKLKEGLQELQGVKAQTVRAAQARQATPQVSPGDAVIAARAEAWKRENPWFDPTLRDEASLVAYAIDQAVFREGRLSPGTDEYWDEVDRRLARRLPERQQARSDDDEDDSEPARIRNGNGHSRDSDFPPQQRRRPAGPSIKVGGRERQLRKGEVYIDEDRKAAMIEAGVWDDPVQRERFLKSYQKYDRDAGRRPR